jgi:O-antigen biosynthesis protein WbqP
MDFLIALIALIVLSPLFIIVAIAIKIDSPGPVFFVQKRIGKNGKLFNCLKFRSMSVDARHDVAGYEYENVSSYVTKTGAFIRRFSIDELPQFFNILTFRMSLIGFRPSQENETELNTARESYDMYQVRPGISGWAQVNGRDVLAANPKKKAEYDAYYLEHFSLWLDIKIFFMTIVKVFKSDDVVEGVIEVPQDSVDKETIEIDNEATIADSITKNVLDNVETVKQKEVV